LLDPFFGSMKVVALFFLLLSQLATCARNSSAAVAQNSTAPVAENSSAVASEAKAKEEPKKDDSADLDALDAAMAKLPAAPNTPTPAAKPKPAPKKTSPKAAAKHAARKAAAKKPAQALNVPSKEDVKLSDLAKKDQNFAIKDDADAVLEAGDALAKKAIDAKHQKELEKVAPAKVVHVNAPAAKADESEGVDSAKTLASDLQGLKERAAEQKEEQAEDEKRHQRMLKTKAIKDKRAQNKKQSPKDVKKQRALNLDRLVKLTKEIKTKSSKSAFIQKEAPVEMHSTLEAHAGKLEEAQKEVNEMKATAKEGKAPTVAEKDVKALAEPSKDEAQEQSKKVEEPSNHDRKVTSASHHPENIDHLKTIQQAVGHLDEATGPAPAAVKEVQEVLKKAQAMTGSDKETQVPQFVADPKAAKLRAKKFKNKMENHVDAMHEALHEHQKQVDTQNHLEKIRKQREAEDAERAKWEQEQARLNQLKIAAENLAREKREKEQQMTIENRTASEAAHKIDDPQADFRARELRKPLPSERKVPRSGANAVQYCGLALASIVATFLA